MDSRHERVGSAYLRAEDREEAEVRERTRRERETYHGLRATLRLERLLRDAELVLVAYL